MTARSPAPENVRQSRQDGSPTMISRASPRFWPIRPARPSESAYSTGRSVRSSPQRKNVPPVKSPATPARASPDDSRTGSPWSARERSNSQTFHSSSASSASRLIESRMSSSLATRRTVAACSDPLTSGSDHPPGPGGVTAGGGCGCGGGRVRPYRGRRVRGVRPWSPGRRPGRNSRGSTGTRARAPIPVPTVHQHHRAELRSGSGCRSSETAQRMPPSAVWARPR